MIKLHAYIAMPLKASSVSSHVLASDALAGIPCPMQSVLCDAQESLTGYWRQTVRLLGHVVPAASAALHLHMAALCASTEQEHSDALRGVTLGLISAWLAASADALQSESLI
jgi:hypothetical protein